MINHSKPLILGLAIAVASITLNAQPATSADPGAPPPGMASLMAGANTSQTLKDLGWLSATLFGKLELTADEKMLILKGFEEGMDGKDGPANPQMAQAQASQFIQQRVTEITERNIAEGNAYLEEIAKKPGVQKSDTGLYYEIIEEGDGPKATPASSVEVNYKGTLIDGTEFDSSYKRGQTATFPVSGVVPGFGEGVQLVGNNGKVILYIPSELGYGSQFNPGSPIPPGSTLVFEVDMVNTDAPALQMPPMPQGQ